MNPIYAMNTCFGDPDYPATLEEIWDIMLQTGIDKGHIEFQATSEGRAMLATVHQLSKSTGIGLAAVMVQVKFQHPETLHTLLKAASTLPEGSMLELTLAWGEWMENLSNQQLDVSVLNQLASVLQLCERRGITISLYPHFGFYLQTTHDAARLIRQAASPRLKATFCGYHWFVTQRPQCPDFRHALDEIMPNLALVNVCGSRPHTAPDGLPATIETLDQGVMDNQGLVAELLHRGFQGDIGLQGYSLRGDPRLQIPRSVALLRQWMGSSST